jgi:hypothetical protein
MTPTFPRSGVSGHAGAVQEMTRDLRIDIIKIRMELRDVTVSIAMS